jgi:hypothetical protein
LEKQLQLQHQDCLIVKTIALMIKLFSALLVMLNPSVMGMARLSLAGRIGLRGKIVFIFENNKRTWPSGNSLKHHADVPPAVALAQQTTTD